MDLDVEDVVAGAVGSVLGRMVLFVVAVWLGASIGGAGIVAGSMAEMRTWRVSTGVWLWAGPLLLFSSWALLNIPFLLFSLVRFVRSEGDGYLAWGVVVAVESLMVMLGWARSFISGWLPVTIAWVSCLTLLIMLGAGIWLLRQHLINLWARDLGLLRAANAERQARKEAEERERMQHEEQR